MFTWARRDERWNFCHSQNKNIFHSYIISSLHNIRHMYVSILSTVVILELFRLNGVNMCFHCPQRNWRREREREEGESNQWERDKDRKGSSPKHNSCVTHSTLTVIRIKQVHFSEIWGCQLIWKRMQLKIGQRISKKGNFLQWEILKFQNWKWSKEASLGSD